MPEVTYRLEGESRVARLVLDCPGPVNTIGQGFLSALEGAVGRAEADQVRGVLIASAKKKSFLDGANLREIMTEATPQSIRFVLQRYHEALAALAQGPFPVVALLDGQTALGGGLELLLWACDHVFAAPGSRVGQPEVNVGLFPGGGGTQTLRRVVGFRRAVELIMSGRVIPAEDLAQTGLVTICPSAELEESARAWIEAHQGVVNRNYDPAFQEPEPLSAEEAREVLAQARTRYTLCPQRPYLQAALEALAAGLELPFAQATRKEIELFLPLMASPHTKNKIDFFFLSTSLAPRLVKVDPGQARPVERLGIIGAGLMGRGIAQVAADRGLKVTLLDVDEAASRAAYEKIGQSLAELVSRGRWPEARREQVPANIGWSADYAELKETPLVIEAVFEDLDLKRQVRAGVQEVNPGAIFASNTSTLPMGDIAAGAARPEQVVGMHYFSPVPLMPLLEVIQGEATSPEAVATAVSLGRVMGKTVILVGDGPGFYTSRCFGRYVMNGFRLAELGLSPWEVDRLALQAGFPQGPLNIYGTAGGAVIHHASHFMAQRLPERFQVPPTLDRLYEAGYVGAGRPCFYLDSKKMIPDQSVRQYIVATQGLPRPSEEEAREILLLGMVGEAFWCLSDGVLRDYASMDLGAVLGIGFPDCWHGPARYVSQRGVGAVQSRLAELADKFELPGLAPAPEFERLLACGLDSGLI